MIRLMTEDDIFGVIQIENEAFSDPWSLSSFIDVVNENFEYAIVYETDDEIIGYAVLQTLVDEAHLINIAVKKGFRHKGIGKEILSFLIEHFREKNYMRMFLDVRVSNKSAVKLYESMGFKNIYRQKSLYQKPCEDGFLMELNLS